MTDASIYTFDGSKIEGPFTYEQLTYLQEKSNLYFWTLGLDKWHNKYQLLNVLNSNSLQTPSIPCPPIITIVPVINDAFYDSLEVALSLIVKEKNVSEVMLGAMAFFQLHKSYLNSITILQKIGELQLKKAVSVFCSDYSDLISSTFPINKEIASILDKLKLRDENIDLYELIRRGWAFFPLSKELILYYSNRFKKSLSFDEINLLIEHELIHPLIALQLIANKNKSNSFDVSSLMGGRFNRFSIKKAYLFWEILNLIFLLLSFSSNRYINFVGGEIVNVWPFVPFFDCNELYWEVNNPYHVSCFHGVLAYYDFSEFIFYSVLPFVLYNIWKLYKRI